MFKAEHVVIVYRVYNAGQVSPCETNLSPSADIVRLRSHMRASRAAEVHLPWPNVTPRLIGLAR